MNTVPKWFTPVAVLALLWNLLGCFMIAMDAMMPPDAVAALPADQQAIHAARAPWMVIGSIVAVAAGALGSLGLVLKRRWATPLLILSVLYLPGGLASLRAETFRGWRDGAKAWWTETKDDLSGETQRRKQREKDLRERRDVF